MTSPSRTTSYIGQMHERMQTLSSEQMGTLNARSLKAMIAWLETRQLDLSMEVCFEDDPLESAKMRGKVALLVDLGAELVGYLGQIGKKPEPEPKEDDE